MTNYGIRLTEKQDYRKTEEITREAFWNIHFPGCDEHYLLHSLRAHPDYISDLDFVAMDGDRIIGNIVYTKSRLISEDNDTVETLTFGPIAVDPEYQRKGAGSLLINHTMNIAVQRKVPAVVILGFPKNYVKHGFVNGARYDIGLDFGKYGAGLLVKMLDDTIPANKRWKFMESNAYQVNMDGFEEFDRTFPPKEKGWSPSQEEFWIASHSYIKTEDDAAE